MKTRVYEILQIPPGRDLFPAACYYLGLFTTYRKTFFPKATPLLFDPLGVGKDATDLARRFPLKYRPLLEEVEYPEGTTPWLRYSVRPNEWTLSGPTMMIFRHAGQFGVQKAHIEFEALMKKEGGTERWKSLFFVLEDWHRQRKLIKEGIK